ncbi:MAG: FliO/MopB family protein [Phycisphaeraceae bacterium]
MGRRLNFNTKAWRQARFGVLVLCVTLPTASALSQSHANADALTDVQRIEQMRERAAAADDAKADATPADSTVSSARVDDRVQEAPADAITLPANEQLPLGAGEPNAFGSGASAQGSSGSLGDGWLMSTLAALGVVLAMVFGLRWLLRRGGVVSGAVPQGSVVEVLSRTTVAPRSHVLLMRVGERVLVVSDSSAGMRTLASIEDAEEVAGLLGSLEASRSGSVTQQFGSVMKKLSGQWSDDEQAASEAALPASFEARPVAEANETRDTVSNLRGRLAALSAAGGGA